jgi:hypothetical protein
MSECRQTIFEPQNNLPALRQANYPFLDIPETCYSHNRNLLQPQQKPVTNPPAGQGR